MTNGASSGIWRRLCSVSGVPTELLGIDASCGCPRLQVVVFPGNPGSAAYFKTFMLAMHRQLGGVADVLAVTHAGHDPQTDHGGRLWDLSQQIDHKLAFLREHVLLPGRPPVVLVGHSIGAAMAIKAVTRLEREQEHEPTGSSVAAVVPPAAAVTLGQQQGCTSPFSTGPCAAGVAGKAGLPRIAKLVAVFPFFETNFPGNFRQRRLRSLAPWYELLGWVGAAVTSLPWALRLGFVRLNAAMDLDAAALTARLLARHTVRNAFYLASHEFKELSQPWDWSLMAALGERLHVMGCEADTWMSRAQYERMLERVPGLQATWHPDLRHAFCISERQSGAVAEAIASIASSLPEMVGLPGLRKEPAASDQAAQAADQVPGGAGQQLWGSRAASASAISVSRAASSGSSSTTVSSSSGAAASAVETAAGTATDSAANAADEDGSDGAASGNEAMEGTKEVATKPEQGGCQRSQSSRPEGDYQDVPSGQRRRLLHGDDLEATAATGAAAVVAAAGGGSAYDGDVNEADDQYVGNGNGTAAGAAAGAGAFHLRRRAPHRDQAAEVLGGKQQTSAMAVVAAADMADQDMAVRSAAADAW